VDRKNRIGDARKFTRIEAALFEFVEIGEIRGLFCRFIRG
jgi:hypothetical protein